MNARLRTATSQFIRAGMANSLSRGIIELPGSSSVERPHDPQCNRMGSLRARSLSLRRFKMDRRQHSLALMLYAYLGAIAAGINFYWSVDDTPLAAAMYDHSALVTSWNPVRAGSLLALAAVAIESH